MLLLTLNISAAQSYYIISSTALTPVTTNYVTSTNYVTATNTVTKTNFVDVTLTNIVIVTTYVTNSGPTNVNSSPIISSQTNFAVEFPNTLRISPAVWDDGLPNGTLTYNWTQISGPGNGWVFDNAHAQTVNVTFPTNGQYVLQLSVSDGALSNSQQYYINVTNPVTVVTNLPEPPSNLHLANDVISSDRLINWTQAGIPGGIPVRTTIYKTLSLSSSGDNTSTIQSALNSCPSGQVVMLPAGTYTCKGLLNMPNNVTLRGAGAGKTILKMAGSGEAFINFGSYTTTWNLSGISTTISSGTTKGSTSINVASTSGISVGGLLMITELNDTSFVNPYGTANGNYANNVDGWDTVNTRSRGQIVVVKGISGNTVTFFPSLYTAYTKTPWASHMNTMCQWSGVENLTVYANNSGIGNNFEFQQAAYCWVSNVESDFADGDHVRIERSANCEVRHSYFHDAFVHSAGTHDNQIGCWSKASANLIIDNIIRRLHVGIMLENGAAGNVVAYNYLEGGYDASVTGGNRPLFGGIEGNHGAHPQFNLFEGNVTPYIRADSYWGSSSDGVLLRNYSIGTGVAHPPINARGTEDLSVTYNLIQMNYAIDIWEEQTRYSVVGNIVGDSTTKSRGLVRKIVSPSGRAYDNPPYCFSYGYASGAGLAGKYTNPTATLIEHGNWDMAGGSIVWSSAIAGRQIPDSLFLTNKPSWFGSLTFPPIDPSHPTMDITSIPAGYRYVHGTDP